MSAISNLGGWSANAWSRIQPLISSPIVLVLVILAAAAVWLYRPFGEKPTLGKILIDSPEIYTRERLVNDRFLQDAWLSAHLDPPSEIQDARQVRGEVRRASIQAGNVKEQASPQPVPGSDAATSPSQGIEPRLSSKARLLDQVDYREVVRSLLIENQLDDRHDLNGNSLYKLKFDTSILPGVNTQSSAQITLRLLPPSFLGDGEVKPVPGSLSELGSNKDIEAWRKVYARWIENLRSRLNQTHYELKDAYFNNEFSHNDYARLIGYFSLYLRVPTGAVAQCPSQVVDSHGHDSTSLRLTTQEHAARKACVKALVEKTIPKTVMTQFDSKAKLGNYANLKEFKEEADAGRPLRVDDTVDLWLNSFFAAKTVKLVLGVPVRETSFVAEGFHHIPAFQNLARLTFFNSYNRPPEGSSDVFHVSEKVFSIAAIDPKKVSSEAFDTLGLDHVRGQKLADFVAAGFAPERFLISPQYPTQIQEDRLKFTEQEFRDVSQGKGVYLVSAELGLLKFAKLARQKMVAFTYGVTPRESADSVHLNLSTHSNVAGQAAGGGETSAAARLQREITSRTVERRSGVVGFSGASADSKHAEFGWVILPRQASMDGQQQVYIQAPAQYALSALVSIPSWWHTARFEVTTSWLDRNGEVMPGTDKQSKYEIDVPTDFEPLEALLLGIEQLGPEIMESRLDPVWLTACRPGAIVIPGRRLWRSTKVTLGYQTADAISVLPNMKGIIANFDTVENQLSVAEEAAWRKKHPAGAVQIQRAVRVWTSQGSLTLPTLATVGIPVDTPSMCPKARPPSSVASK